MKTADFPYPRRYNSLRLPGFDYSSATALYSITIKTDASRPLFGDIKLAKQVVAALLNDQTLARLRVCAYSLLPDHLHLLAGVKQSGKALPSLIGAFESFTTQVYWKRANEIVKTRLIALPSQSVRKGDPDENRILLKALSEGRLSLTPEAVDMKNWPRLRPEHFLGKLLWQRSFNDHVIRNEADFRENVDYIMLNSVRRGYVSRPEFYPFSGFGIAGLIDNFADGGSGATTEGRPYMS